MLRVFSFLPPIGFYILAIAILAAAYAMHSEMLAADPQANTNQVWLVGGIIAFLFGFGGVQKTLEEREEKNTPRVSSSDVMQKLTPSETGKADPQLDIAPRNVSGPGLDTPLGRVRARSEGLDV